MHKTLLPAIFAIFATTNALNAQRPNFPTKEDLKGKAAGALVTRPGKYGPSDADWGLLLARENRRDAGSRLIRVVVVRQRSQGKAAAAPIFNLVGGPGKSNIWGSGEMPPPLLDHLDVVRVGYRGIDSNIELTCPEYNRALQGDAPLSRASILETRAALRACNDRLRNEGVDIDGYTLADVVEDIEAVRQAFGYERISFLAVSWGTQIAYAYAMRYTERVDRMVLVAAGGRARGFDLWDPSIIDKKLRRLGALWKKDPLAVASSADIVVTIRRVLASLPQEWRGHRINRDKVRLSTYYMLTAGVVDMTQVLDAYSAADNGDYAGLALLSWAYDQEIAGRSQRKYGPYDGEFFSKVMSSGLDPKRDYIAEMDPADSIIGSPAAKLLWGAASHGGWPVAAIPKAYCRDLDIETKTLVVMGDLDFSSPHEYVQAELMPHLKNGRLLLLPNMGHVDVAKLQSQAFRHLLVRFFRDGVVDSSEYTDQNICFLPAETLADQARRLIPKRGGS